MSKRVFIESPYSSETSEGILENVKYARLAMQDSLLRGEAPFLSHLLYTQHPDDDFVSDNDLDKQCVGRDKAIQAAESWREVSDLTVFYCDRGMSPGMIKALDKIKNNPFNKFEFRYILIKK
mgnify:CR=1 FL=1